MYELLNPLHLQPDCLHEYGDTTLCSSDACLQLHFINCVPLRGQYSNVAHGQPSSLHGVNIGRLFGRSLKSV